MTKIITAVLFWLFIGGAWVGNVVRLLQCDFKPSYKAEVIYALGLFTPTYLGTVWMDLE